MCLWSASVDWLMLTVFICFAFLRKCFPSPLKTIDADTVIIQNENHWNKHQSRVGDTTRARNGDVSANNNTHTHAHHSSKFIMCCINYVRRLFVKTEACGCFFIADAHTPSLQRKQNNVYEVSEIMCESWNSFSFRFIFIYLFFVPSLKLEPEVSASRVWFWWILHLKRATCRAMPFYRQQSHLI